MRPEIGFKGFADEWEQHKLSEICDFEKGKGLSKDDISDTENIHAFYMDNYLQSMECSLTVFFLKVIR